MANYSDLVKTSEQTGTGKQGAVTNNSDLPLTGNTAGDLQLVTSTNKLVIWNGTGWYSVGDIANAVPVISSGADASYTFAKDGTPIVITLVASDTEYGGDLIYSHSVTTGSLTNGGGATATVVQGTGSNTNQFTITPTTTEAYAGSFSITFSASDGASAGTAVSAFTLAFFTQMHQPSGTTLLLGLSFDGSALGKTGSWGTPSTLGTGIESYYTSGGYNSVMAGHAGFPSAIRGNNGLGVSELNSANSSKGKTFIAWYKGTQSLNGSSYSLGVPIISNYANTWQGFGTNNGKISAHSGSASARTEGTTNVADGNWHMLTWVHSDGTHTRFSNNDVGMYVDGVYEATHSIPPGNVTYIKINEMFVSWSGDTAWQPPTRVDAFQIFDDELTDAQILEIYQGG